MEIILNTYNLWASLFWVSGTNIKFCSNSDSTRNNRCLSQNKVSEGKKWALELAAFSSLDGIFMPVTGQHLITLQIHLQYHFVPLASPQAHSCFTYALPGTSHLYNSLAPRGHKYILLCLCLQCCWHRTLSSLRAEASLYYVAKLRTVAMIQVDSIKSSSENESKNIYVSNWWIKIIVSKI